MKKGGGRHSRLSRALVLSAAIQVCHHLKAARNVFPKGGGVSDSQGLKRNREINL
jgi:hypothetical protein